MIVDDYVTDDFDHERETCSQFFFYIHHELRLELYSLFTLGKCRPKWQILNLILNRNWKLSKSNFFYLGVGFFSGYKSNTRIRDKNTTVLDAP
jgi:hypothetical protein